jgi:hypothetical protein
MQRLESLICVVSIHAEIQRDRSKVLDQYWFFKERWFAYLFRGFETPSKLVTLVEALPTCVHYENESK